MNIKTSFTALLLTTVLGVGCKKGEDPNVLRDEALKQNVYQLLSADPQYSSFVKLVKETGMDTVLSSSRVFTVFAPLNDALTNIDPVSISTPALKKRFVANHIAPSMFSLNGTTASVRLEMLNGKFNQIAGSKIESAAVKTANLYAANGIVHQITAPVYALDNCWELMTGAKAPAKQRSFLGTLNRNLFDVTNAVVIGVDPNTGANIYKAGTDSVFANMFLRRVQNLVDEKRQFTVFVPEDGAWDAELATYAPFFNASTVDSTVFATAWNVYRDLAVDTLLEPASLPDTVYLRSGAKIPIKRSNISQTIKTSNGYVYVMKALGIPPVAKFPARIIQGESFVATSADRRSNTFIRDRYNDVLRQNFRDVLVLNHGVALYNLRYEVSEVPNIKYRAFWVAVNDFQTATYTQRLGVGSPISASLPYTNVLANVKTEVLLGEFTVGRYYPVLNLFLTAANSTANASNPLVLDYIKLVPSL